MPPSHKILACKYIIHEMSEFCNRNEKKVDMWIRHVVVPGITDDDKYLEELGYFIGQFTKILSIP